MASVSASSTISRSALRRWIEQAKSYVSPERDSGTLVPRTKNWKRLLRPFARKLVVVAEMGGTLAEIAPVIGPSVKGTLKALSQVLAIVETHYQNQDSIAHLREKLQSLEERLVDHCPTSENAALLVSRLVSTQRTLEELLSASSLDHSHVASVIAQCERDISFFLDEFSAVGHIETQALVQRKNDDLTNRVASLESQLAQQGLQMAAQSEQMALLVSMMTSVVSQMLPGPTMLSTRIWVIDPFGAKHLFAQVPSSYEALGRELLERYSMDRCRGPILERYVNRHLFEVSMDDSQEVTVIGDQELGSLDSECTVIISVVMFSTRSAGQVECPLCKGIIVGTTDAKRVLCQTCERNVQISQEVGEEMEYPQSGFLEEDVTYLRQIVVNMVDTTAVGRMKYQGEPDFEGGEAENTLGSVEDHSSPLSNGPEAPGSNIDDAELERAQLRFLRRLLPKDKGVMPAPLFTETGLTPVRHKHLLLLLATARNALGLPESHQVRKAYRDALLAYDERRGGWIRDMETVLRRLPGLPVEMGVNRMQSLAGIDNLIEGVQASCAFHLRDIQSRGIGNLLEAFEETLLTECEGTNYQPFPD